MPNFVTLGDLASQTLFPRGRMADEQGPVSCVPSKDGLPAPTIGLIFRNAIAAETVFFSFSTADEDYHAPNEFFRLQRLDDGLKAWNRYWQLLGERGTTRLGTGRAT